MLSVLEVIILGLVEGITEWLPISSTGHMLLLYELFHINEQDPFWSMFLVVIQLGAILAVVVLYFQRLWPFRMPDRGASGAEKLVSIVDREKMIMWVKIVISCIPAVIVGLTIDDWIEPKYLRASLKKQGLEGNWRAYDSKGKPLAGAASVATNAR